MITTEFVRLTQADVRAQLRARGVSFKSLPETGEFLVGGSYFTDSLSDALATGIAIAQARHTYPDYE